MWPTYPPHLGLFLTASFTLVVSVYDKLLGVGILIQCSSVTQSPAMTNWPSNSSIMQTSTNMIKLQQQDSPLMPSHIQQMAILDWNTLPNFIHISFQTLWKNHLEMTMVGKSIFRRNHMFRALQFTGFCSCSLREGFQKKKKVNRIFH